MSNVKLGSVLKVMHGYAFKSENYVERSPYRLITLGNFEEGNNSFRFNDAKATYYGAEFPKDFIINEGDLIMPLTEQVVGLFGNSAFVPHVEDYTFVLNQRVGKVVCDEKKVDKYYMHYLLATNSVKNQLEARASGTRQRNISPDDVYDVEVSLPPLDIQKQIGNLLYQIEQKQGLNSAICSNLEAMAKLLYDYWFVQFDFPDENGKPYKSSGGKMVWNDELKREIPAGWEVKPLRDVCSIVLGGTPKTEKSEYWNGDINWLNSGEVAQFPVVETELKITQQGLDNSATVLMPVGTVIISITGNLRVSFLAIDTCGNQSIVGIMENEFYKKSYLYPVLKDLLAVYNRVATGNCQQHISKGTIEESFMLCPPSSVMFEYRNKVDPVFDRIIELGHENQQLVSLRDFLLPMLMNGQVKVGA